ncbi:hypothetical protein PR202_ga23438 [Eleusine coracana subsp. coracana]|uniref:Secreted protein n=1 Tax=Eleusine coracana subsp. coracana TaxID=191504 RepID=A0AAV5D474_ELECO|nr:hypothetical protein PR202_ga23438 [Eleusine coracana subsp. coracana]
MDWPQVLLLMVLIVEHGEMLEMVDKGAMVRSSITVYVMLPCTNPLAGAVFRISAEIKVHATNCASQPFRLGVLHATMAARWLETARALGSIRAPRHFTAGGRTPAPAGAFVPIKKGALA